MNNLKLLVTETVSHHTTNLDRSNSTRWKRIQDEDDQQDIVAENFFESIVINFTECSDEDDDD